MAAEAGTKVILQVGDGASPTQFTTVAGQQNTELVKSTETADITDKSHGGQGSTLATLRRATINCSGVAVWPDTLGLDRVRIHHDALATIEAKAILNDAGAHYFGFWTITSLNISGTHTGAVEYSFTLENAEPINYAAS